MYVFFVSIRVEYEDWELSAIAFFLKDSCYIKYLFKPNLANTVILNMYLYTYI